MCTTPFKTQTNKQGVPETRLETDQQFDFGRLADKYFIAEPGEIAAQESRSDSAEPVQKPQDENP